MLYKNPNKTFSRVIIVGAILFYTLDGEDLYFDTGTLCASNMVVFDWSTKIVCKTFLFYITDIFFFIFIHYSSKIIGFNDCVQISFYEFTVISSVINLVKKIFVVIISYS